jgi:NADH-quinone oxidoreductase subunit N
MMNAPVIWIILPICISILMIVGLRWRGVIVYVGVGTSLFLAALAWWLPVGEAIGKGSLSFEIYQSLLIFGRELTLTNYEKPVVALLYFGAAFWMGGTIAARSDSELVPISLSITAMLVASLLVEPFLYAALIIEIIVLGCVVLLNSSQVRGRKGILRFWIFETLGMPFILFLGWMLAGVEANPGEAALVTQVAVFAAFGFSLLLAVFPFHTWIPMVAEGTHPYISAFVFYVISFAIPLFGLSFLDRYNWLYTSPWLFVYLRLTGVLMVITGGLGAIFQNHLGRLMGFAMLLEIGNTLLIFSTGIGTAVNRINFAIYFMFMLLRCLGLGMLALSMSIIRSRQGNLSYNQITGAGRNLMLTTLTLFVAFLALGGFPLTAGFPIHLSLWQHLFQQFPLAAYAEILGSIGLLVAGLRAVAILVTGSDEHPWRITETLQERLLLMIAFSLIMLVGLFPQWFLPILIDIARTYFRLGS